MITLKNSQKKIKIDTKKIEQDAAQLLHLLKYTDFDLGILITTNKTIRNYNKNFRDKDKATDILSFPYYHDVQAVKRVRVPKGEEKNLGDLIFSAEYVVQEAKKHGMSLEERFQLLLVHGICHLLGYDHIEDADYRRMRGKEAYLKKCLKLDSNKRACIF